ncbi:hypothetical protein [Lentimicrobium sp.]|uniref:hypothetical protein n=1 Tax=Lentimicrobium sp. TaxID=2034841 RepID=UPI0025EDA1F2|nr:hypothetical protein [Lentimicrobium sp.]MCO5257104.1 hypothetical protein [Lentimicrobium sp.]HPF65168.1 hypothetical protein [Lentimicrobium sp.]HPR26177.1 hypothetical protein [Lentimicrobium sp.]
MLRKFSRSGVYLQILFILAVSSFYLFSPHPGFASQVFPENAAPLGRWLSGILPDNELVIRITALILILLNAAGFNIILNHHDLAPRQSLFTALIASVFFLFTGQAEAMIAPLAALLLLLISLHSTMKLYAEPYPYTLVLNASIFVAMASMIYPLAILFAFFIWMAFFTLRISSWREWIISLTGLIVPYVYLAFWFFWNDRLAVAFNEYHAFFNDFDINWSKPGFLQTVVLFLLGSILIISMSVFLNDAGEKIISIRKKMWINAQFLWVAMAVLLLSGKAALLALPLCYLPMALMAGYLITKSRRSWPYDIALGLFLLLVILLRLGF